MSIRNCDACGKRPHTQDDLHGKGNRVFNEHKSKSAKVLRCTVCGREISTALAPSDKKETA